MPTLKEQIAAVERRAMQARIANTSERERLTGWVPTYSFVNGSDQFVTFTAPCGLQIMVPPHSTVKW